jgi:hypothetical protein
MPAVHIARGLGRGGLWAEAWSGEKLSTSEAASSLAGLLCTSGVIGMKPGMTRAWLWLGVMSSSRPRYAKPHSTRKPTAPPTTRTMGKDPAGAGACREQGITGTRAVSCRSTLSFSRSALAATHILR